MAVGAVLLGVDVLTEGRVEVGPFQIVGGESIAGEHRVRIAGVDDFREGLAGVPVEGEGRPHDPYNGAVVAVVAQKLVELVIVARERGLARAAQAEGEVVVAARVRSAVLRCGQTAEAVGVDENALLAVFRASAGDEIAGADVAELAHEHVAAFHDGHAIHAGIAGERPLPCDLQILRINGHGVVALRGHEILRRGHERHIGRGGEVGEREVGRRVGRGCKRRGRKRHSRLLSLGG